MLSSSSLFVNKNSTPSTHSFIVNQIAWETGEQTVSVTYQQLVFKVRQRPKNLVFHLERIYFTYNNQLSDQLYAAIVDLLWVLDGKGEPLSQRMILAVSSVLSKQQSNQLDSYLKEKDKSLLKANKFSLFSQGFIGFRQLLMQSEQVETLHDPLLVARDYIEYSQLDLAVEMLEVAILAEPKRIELQTELLHLYKMMKDHLSYSKLTEQLKGLNSVISQEWLDEEKYFDGLKS